jgi:hypothetical protein
MPLTRDFAADRAIQTTDEGTDIKQVMGWVATLGVAIIGSLAGGCVGYLTGAGVATLIGASVGFGVMFLCGFCTFGPAKAVVDKAYADYAPPDAARVGGLALARTFSLHVTVHSLRNTINTEGILSFFGKKNDSFIEIKCGRQLDDDAEFFQGKNPPKRTCVSHTETFEETFIFNVSPTDNALIVTLYDQDIIGDDLVGEAWIDITKEILEAGFPQKRGYKLIREEGLLFGTNKKKTGTIIMSFSPGDGFPERTKNIIKTKAPLEWKRLEDTSNATLKESIAKYGKTSYGSLVRDGTLMTTAKMSSAGYHPGSGVILNAGTGSATQLPEGPHDSNV